MTPRLSVLMPAFNRAHWLGGAIDSVLAPGLDLELVVVDNGSSDGTWALLEDRARRDPRLRIIRWALNDGAEVFPALLEMARGEYVNFFADDDEMLAGGLARKMEILDRHPDIGLVFSTVRCMDGLGKDLGEGAWTVISPEDVLGRKDLFQSLILGNFVPMPAAMFRRALSPTGEILRDGTFLSSRDWPFWLDLCQRTPIAFLREPTVRLRMHPGQETVVEGIRNGTFAEVSLRVWRRFMIDTDPPFIPSADAWDVMNRSLFGALQATHGQDMAPIREGLSRLQALRNAQEDMLAQTREVREAAYPELFLHQPDWPGGGWEVLARSFIEAFASDEGAVLAFVLDPALDGTPSLDQARKAVAEAVPGAAGIRVLDSGSLLGALRAFPHLQWITGNPRAPGALDGRRGRRLLEALGQATERGRS